MNIYPEYTIIIAQKQVFFASLTEVLCKKMKVGGEQSRGVRFVGLKSFALLQILLKKSRDCDIITVYSKNLRRNDI